MVSWLFRRLVKAGAALVLLAVVVAAATAVAWSLGVADLATAATELDEVDLTIGAAAVTRAAVAQAVVFAVSTTNGAASEEALAAALGEATANVDAYDQLSVRLAAQQSPPESASLIGLSDQGRAVLALLAAGEVETARSVTEGEFEVQYRNSVGALAMARSDLMTTVSAARSLTTKAATAVRLSVTLGLSALLLVVAWFVHRRRITRLRRSSDVEIEVATSRIGRLEDMLLAVSHRIRTPLTSIYGLSDVLVHKKGIQGLERELVALINSESADLYRIAEDVLAATQLESGTLQLDTGIVSLRDIVEGAVKSSRAGGADVTVECAETWVVSDGKKLQQILRNLISNAVQHGAQPIAVVVVESEGAVQCIVTDHGPGLSEHHMTAVAGAGHGLDVAYGLSEVIGATLEHSRVGDVTCFTLSWSDDGKGPEETPPLPSAATVGSASGPVAEHAGTGQAP